jgi:hypothetical protein
MKLGPFTYQDAETKTTYLVPAYEVKKLTAPKLKQTVCVELGPHHGPEFDDHSDKFIRKCLGR